MLDDRDASMAGARSAMHVGALALSLACGLGLVSADARALCVGPRPAMLSAMLLTPLDRPLPQNGGLLFELSRVEAGAPRTPLPTAVTLVSGEVRLRFVREELHGLHVYRPASPPEPGAWTLEGLGAPREVAIAPALPDLRAPRRPTVRLGLRERSVPSPRGTMMERRWNERVRWRSDAPDGFVQLRWLRHGGDEMWASRVARGAREVRVEGRTVRCGVAGAPATGLRLGDQPALRWVDLYGRTSSWSDLARVTSALD